MFEHGTKPSFFGRMTDLLRRGKIREEQLAQLKTLIRNAVWDGTVTEKELENIDNFFNDSDLTAEQFAELKNDVLNDVLEDYCADRRVTPEEAGNLTQMAIALGFNTQSLRLIDAHIANYRLMHYVETCPFDSLPVTGRAGIVLIRGEKEHLSMPCSLCEERVVNRRMVGQSHGVSIRVMKGVSYRVGQSRGRLLSDTEIVPVSQGEFTVTSQRLVFSGDRKSLNVPFGKILDLEPFADGFRLSMTNRQKPVYLQFVSRSSAELTMLFISRLLNG